jgi:hypothetical protein
VRTEGTEVRRIDGVTSNRIIHAAQIYTYEGVIAILAVALVGPLVAIHKVALPFGIRVAVSEASMAGDRLVVDARSDPFLARSAGKAAVSTAGCC